MCLLSVVILIVYFMIVDGLIFVLIRDKKGKTLKQLLYICIAFSAFYLAALFSQNAQKTKPLWILADGLAVLPLCLLLLVLVVKKQKEVWKETGRKTITQLLSQYRYEIVLVLVTVFSRIWLLDTVQKWDSNDYYYAIMSACSNFDFSPKSFFYAFRLISHPSHGYGFWVGIGEFLTPEEPAGVLLVNLVFTAAASVILYQLFRMYLTRMKEWQAFLGTLLCLCIPLYWCGFSYIMPDYLMAVFIVLMIVADVKKEWILLFFWGLMACFSKEIGIVLVRLIFLQKCFTCCATVQVDWERESEWS